MPPLLGKGSTGSASSGQRKRLLNKESRLSGAVRPGRRRGVGVGSLTVADVLARRESSRDCLKVGEQGAWAQFRTAQLPSRRETRAASRGILGDPGVPGRQPSCGGPGWGDRRLAQSWKRSRFT